MRTALIRATALAGRALAAGCVGLATLVAFVPGFGLGLVFLIPPPILAGRRFLAEIRTRFTIAPPYAPEPPEPVRRPDGLYEQGGGLHKRPWWPRLSDRLGWLLGDRATGRDLAFLLTGPVVGVLPALPAIGLAAAAAGAVTGGWHLLASGARLPAALWSQPGAVPWGGWLLAAGPVGVAVAPWCVRAYGGWCRLMLGPGRRRAPGARAEWWVTHLLAVARLFALAMTALLAVGATLVFGAALGVVFLTGLVLVFPPVVDVVRRLAGIRRDLAGRWSGWPIAVPYRPVPAPDVEPDGRFRVDRQLFRTEAWARWSSRFGTYTRDPATWRDAAWLLVEPVTAGALAAVGPLAWYEAMSRIVGPALADLFTGHGTPMTALRIAGGLAAVAAVITVAPTLLRWHGRVTGWLLAPTRAAALARRIEKLTESRAAAAADQAAELRRIERDLHDGAQARLVSIGLTIGVVEGLIDTDPATARKLAAQAREASETALVELRALVRGIHPPVLAERGLGDAVRTLALDGPVPVAVAVDLPGRFPPAIESAVYFAVAEAVANAVRHAAATAIGINLGWEAGRLVATVRDDGRGGADARLGTGLDGLRRRLGTFDGVLTVTSPPGGPTVLRVEVPCALSSPKTSSS